MPTPPSTSDTGKSDFPRTSSLPPWHLVTHSGKPDAHFIREAAIALLARDCLIGHDSFEVENAVRWAREVVNRHENAEHEGDCTNQPQTCIRCLIDEAKREATEIHDD